MNVQNLSVDELLNYSEPKTDLEHKLLDALKETYDDLLYFRQIAPACGDHGDDE